MIIKCAIVDDEPLAVELLASYVEKIPFLELCGKYTNATDALHGIGQNPVDLLFLDIQMPELNGLELSRHPDARTQRTGVEPNGSRDYPHRVYHRLQPICR